LIGGGMAKHIFVTGGVVSSLGKGITTGAIGMLLKRMGLSVRLQKMDPYLNVDPGTMSPHEHGEVYVTDDGAEADLDLGHYERFTGDSMSRESNCTMGQVYQAVIAKERRGDFLGKTVQVVPHVTDEIKLRIRSLAKPGVDVVVTEIGGTAGDIEGGPMLEAVRQLRHDLGPKNCLFVHLTLVPFIRAAGEAKTKPTQQSVGELRRIGIQPDILVVRTEKELGEDARKKIALFCNVEDECVVIEKDVETSIYEVPLMLHQQGLDALIAERLGLPAEEPRLEDWRAVVESVKHPSRKVRIGMVGKYMKVQDAYKSIIEAIAHAGMRHGAKVDLVRIDAGELEKDGTGKLAGLDGILVPGGFGDRGTEGKIAAIRYARENGIPFLGLCLGMQLAVIEFGRNVCMLEGSGSSEFKPGCSDPVIDLLPGQVGVSEKGGTMRLGAYHCIVKQGTKAFAAYGEELVSERHRHRYELNIKYQEKLEGCGMMLSGFSPGGFLAEIVEIPSHPWFVAVQFHPEFKSMPVRPHPLFCGFVGAALDAKEGDLDASHGPV